MWGFHLFILKTAKDKNIGIFNKKRFDPLLEKLHMCVNTIAEVDGKSIMAEAL